MSPCGGSVYGYYQNGELLLIESRYGAELGFSSKLIYFRSNQIVKIIYWEYFAEWEKYEKKYPSDKFEWDPSKMTYSDTIYTAVLAKQIFFEKKSKKKVVSQKVDRLLLNTLLTCGQQMKAELNDIIIQMDSLQQITEMPYICENGICGDKLYWKAVNMGRNTLELLIDKLADTTTTRAPVPLFGINYTVADIAFQVLSETIHEIPVFELLGVPFDVNGCGYCSYWNYLNQDYSNRIKFRDAVKSWYRNNKDNLVWIKSDQFATCDCSGQHPNGGHYILKNKN